MSGGFDTSDSSDRIMKIPGIILQMKKASTVVQIDRVTNATKLTFAITGNSVSTRLWNGQDFFSQKSIEFCPAVLGFF